MTKSFRKPSLIPRKKDFKPKMGLLRLADYRNTRPSGEYWKKWPSNKLAKGTSKINGHKLREMAVANGYRDMTMLETVVTDLTEGAKTGCKGVFRNNTCSQNAPSAYEYGYHVSDALADWINKGFVRGPLDKSDVPQERKINGIMTKLKPTGAVRVILNLSAPKGSSVNDGIDNRDFPATMSSTTKWLRILAKAGKACKMVKVDWGDAYKHISVHEDDVNMQWFEWLGKYFCELCLVFGSISSVGIYDRTAKLVLWIVIARSGIPSSLVSQHLDDCCAAAPKDDDVIYSFDNEYQAVCHELGISLAPRDNPEKSFAPTTEGCVCYINHHPFLMFYHFSGRVNHRRPQAVDDLLCQKNGKT